jgi:hypothetical protein
VRQLALRLCPKSLNIGVHGTHKLGEFTHSETLLTPSLAFDYLETHGTGENVYWHKLCFAFFFRQFLPETFFSPTNILRRSRDSSVGNSDWLRAGRQSGQSSSSGRVKNFLFSTSSRPALGPTQPPTQWVPGAVSPGIKRPGREADHSPAASAEANKMWTYTSTPPYVFMA